MRKSVSNRDNHSDLIQRRVAARHDSTTNTKSTFNISRSMLRLYNAQKKSWSLSVAEMRDFSVKMSGASACFGYAQQPEKAYRRCTHRLILTNSTL